MDYLQIAIKLVVVLILLLIIIRLMGQKELAQVTPLDLVLIIVIGEMAGGSVIDKELNALHVIFTLSMWALLIYIFETIKRRSKKFADVVIGTPALIISHGRVNEVAQRELRLTDREIEALLRQKGVFDINHVEKAYIEVSGALSVKTKE